MGRGFLKLYQGLLNRRPYLVQAVQSGLLMGAGDTISQVFIDETPIKDFDYKRMLRFASIGFFVAGPTLRVWYGILNNKVGSKGPKVAVMKVFFDQCFFAPCFLPTILIAVPALQGENWETIKSEVKANYFDVLKTNYCVWPWVQIVNFYLVPLQYQVLIAQCVALFWNTYLSWKTNKKVQVIEVK